ncbi:MAG: DUF4198 domain-containing protein [Candidatus Adiutrix sp.]|jgi:cobalt/nickel transport protein|nr:DUF4198 domain-containing protein [Candidatus Adiutrix sp.]
MKTLIAYALTLILLAALAGPAQAHFGLVIPSAPVVTETKDAEIKLDVKFWHPFENSGMDLAKPKSFQVYVGGQAIDLRPTLKESKERSFTTWQTAYKLARPGLYTFVMEPAPYWEPEEDCFIIHYTKVYVEAFGVDEGWDQPTPGLKTEIVPLSKPTALYAGNVFTGQVLLDSRPVPGAQVEIEWYPGPDLKGQAPYENLVTQVVKADQAGIFSYAAPSSGWWGFAGLNTADYKLKENGQDKEVELGAVLWVFFQEKPTAEPLK